MRTTLVTIPHLHPALGAMRRRQFLKATGAMAVCATLPRLPGATARRFKTQLFPSDLPSSQWGQFQAAGFTQPACGVIYRLKDKVTNGLALGLTEDDLAAVKLLAEKK